MYMLNTTINRRSLRLRYHRILRHCPTATTWIVRKTVFEQKLTRKYVKSACIMPIQYEETEISIDFLLLREEKKQTGERNFNVCAVVYKTTQIPASNILCALLLSVCRRIIIINHRQDAIAVYYITWTTIV